MHPTELLSCSEVISASGVMVRSHCSGGSKGGAPPLGAQILSVSCSFGENLAKLYVGASPGELVPPPRGNPGSATALPDTDKDTETNKL